MQGPDQFAELMRRMADLERRINNTIRQARVTEVDAKKGLHKVAYALDDQEKDVISPWNPWTERAGKIKSWNPPTKDEQVLMINPGGEIGMHSWSMNGGFSDKFPAPHDKEAEQVSQVDDGKNPPEKFAYTHRTESSMTQKVKQGNYTTEAGGTKTTEAKDRVDIKQGPGKHKLSPQKKGTGSVMTS